MNDVSQLIETLDAHPEWLLLRKGSRPFPVSRHELSIDGTDEKVLFEFIDDEGVRRSRITSIAIVENEVRLDTSGQFGSEASTITLTPRVAARVLTEELRLAREQIANDIAALIEPSFPDAKLERVALNVDGGRIAQILYKTLDGPAAAVADVTAKLDPESFLASAITWLELLSTRKKNPILSISIIAEKPRAANLQKLHPLLNDKWRSKINIVRIDRTGDSPRLQVLANRRLSELWREKPRKLIRPDSELPSKLARQVMSMSFNSIDSVNTRNGKTLRFNGLQFARVRTVMKTERAWFGMTREMVPLTEDSRPKLEELINELAEFRSPDSSNLRHRYYKASPEAWLESILRRDVKQLDANLFVSPVYNQFRSAGDKIDLLALRNDGRLVLVEIKTSPDRTMPFQAAGYWRRIELQRRRGVLADADLFEGREIADQPTLVYLVAPAWSYHPDHERFAAMVSREIEMWRFELHEDWRREIRVVGRSSAHHV